MTPTHETSRNKADGLKRLGWHGNRCCSFLMRVDYGQHHLYSNSKQLIIKV